MPPCVCGFVERPSLNRHGPVSVIGLLVFSPPSDGPGNRLEALLARAKQIRHPPIVFAACALF